MIKKCVGFDMNILCYTPSHQSCVRTAIQEILDLQFRAASPLKNIGSSTPRSKKPYASDS